MFTLQFLNFISININIEIYSIMFRYLKTFFQKFDTGSFYDVSLRGKHCCYHVHLHKRSHRQLPLSNQLERVQGKSDDQ